MTCFRFEIIVPDMFANDVFKSGFFEFHSINKKI